MNRETQHRRCRTPASGKVFCLALLAAVLSSAAAYAAPLSLSELDALADWVDCSESCELAAPVEKQLCIAGCGQPSPKWEKDGVAPVSRSDLDLARLEFADGGAETEICYRDGGVVVPAPLCPGQLCLDTPVCSAEDCALPDAQRPPACLPAVCQALPQRTPADCYDDDWDGIPAWLERLLGTSDEVPEELCASDSTCGFDQLCRRDAFLGANLCAERECAESGCSAFHLEVVSVDDQQLLVHVIFDHAVVAPRVLDLYIDYDHNDLVLVEARPLPNLSRFGKELHSSHTAAGLLRLSVLDRSQGKPVLPGPLVELVFQRNSDDPTTLSFTEDPDLREKAMAPRQAAHQAQLREDQLWGSALYIAPRADARGSRLLLWYSFDDERSPLSWANIPSGEELCSRDPDCANETEPLERARRIARFDALQRGQLSHVKGVEGVNRGGVWLDGSNSHLKMPLQILEPYEAAGQSFSWSTWFFTEGPGPNDDPARSQVLFAHVAPDERSRFGLVLNPDGEGNFDLSFFRGDLLAPHSMSHRTFLRGIPERQWRHVGFTLDAESGMVELYADGVLTATDQFPPSPPPVFCPQFARGADVLVSLEGEFLGGQPSETVWFAPKRGATSRLEAMDINGLAPRVILDDGAVSFRDVDYLASLDLIAFSSNWSGNWEIWTANSDGSDPRQITVGFGDEERGIRARRPRWAPDASALVFESNVYDVASGHNPARTSQLYFVKMDPRTGDAAIPMEDGGTTTQLEYAFHSVANTLSAYQVTNSDQNATNAFWLTGRSGNQQGQLVFERADERFRGNQIHRVLLPENLRDAASEAIPGIAAGEDEARLLAAGRRVRVGVRPIENIPVVYERSSVNWGPSTAFAATVVERAGYAEVTIRHSTDHYEEGCWDTNRNRVDDFEEDRNGDGEWNRDDCAPSSITNLYVPYDASRFDPAIDADDLERAKSSGSLEGTAKALSFSTVVNDQGSFVRIMVDSPGDDIPLEPGLLLKLRFVRKEPGSPSVPFAAVERHHASRIFVLDLASTSPAAELDLAGRMESVQEAALSPDMDKVLFYGLSQARPVLVRSKNLRSLADADRLLDSPLQVAGIRWTREDRHLACNWAGGFRHPNNRLIRSGLRGGLDDLRVYAGLRDPDSFRSEAERGRERLEVDGKLEGIETADPLCVRNSDCSPFQICDEGACRLLSCDPEDPYACQEVGGSCALRPVSARAGDGSSESLRHVCTTECSFDNQCYTEACGNGPCLFCAQETGSCVECRNVVLEYGDYRVATTEGCPDRNGWRCESGACVSECYSVRDGQSIYRCDPALESCVQGRCVPLKWDWEDLAPASIAGLSETRYEHIPGARRTVALGETTTISIEAWGREDYGRPAELLVEARAEADGRSLYSGDWFVVNRVLVHNRNEAEAQARPYTIHVPYPISDLRMRLVNSPYGDLNAGSTGLGDKDKDFCIAEALEAGEDPARCNHRPPGSAFHLGYPAVLTDEELSEACRDNQGAGCLDVRGGTREYLPPGQKGVAIMKVFVNNSTVAPLENHICSWEGQDSPIEPGTGRLRKLFYGDISREESAQKEAFCEANPGVCTPSGLLDFTQASQGAWALLNCNYRNDLEAEAAFVRYQVSPYIQVFQSGAVRETADSCWVELDALRREQCYELMGGDALVDPLAAGMELFQTLEVSLPRSFGHDRGFSRVELPRYPVKVKVRGLRGSGLKLRAGEETLSVGGSGEVEAQFETPLPPGRRFAVALVAQPTGQNASLCELLGSERREMSSSGVELEVNCRPAGQIGGLVSGLSGGEVQLSLSAQAGEQGATIAAINGDLIRVGNGAFTFPRRLLAGSSYQVRVNQSPIAPPQSCSITAAESGSVAQGITSEIRVRCVPMGPRNLGGVVMGLKGSGLVLFNSATHETLAVNGPNFRFNKLVQPGVSFSVSVASEPSDPHQFCEVENGVGIMPNYDLMDIEVVCSDRPVYYVRPQVAGLQGRGLQLILNDSEILEITRNGEHRFSTTLLEDAAFSVKVHNQPQLPDQNCEVVAGEGLIEGEDFVDTHVVCSNIVEEPGQYSLSGVVKGLIGKGLVLTLASQSLDVDQNGPFRFKDPISDGEEYHVKVKERCELVDDGSDPDGKPKEVCESTTTPPQTCRVTNARGRVSGADVSGVVVSCTPTATVRVRVSEGGSSGPVAIAGKLVSADSGRAVAELHPEAMLPRNGAAFPMYSMGRATLENEEPVPLAGGEYVLYLWLNLDNSTDSEGRPTFGAGDPVLSHAFTLTLPSGQSAHTHQLTFDLSDFVAAVEEPVILRSDTIAADSSVRCWWLHPTGKAPEIPVSGALGEARVNCEPRRAPCFTYLSAVGTRQGTTHENLPLPPGEYDLACWWDANGDNTLNATDQKGFIADTTVDGPGILNAQSIINLSAP